jgi:hypothetical protein
MSDDARTAVPSRAADSGASKPRERRRFALYLLPVVGFPLLLMIAAFVIVPTRWFDLHSKNTYLANLGWGANLAGRDCKILIYGDSSALVGLDPAVIREQTGLATCNVAEFEGVTLVTHTWLVDQFLERNARPRFIVFFYTPEDFSTPNDWASTNVGTFEAVSFALEHERTWRTAMELGTHPSITLGWAEQGMRMLMENPRAKAVDADATHVRETRDGQLPVTSSGIMRCDGSRHERLPDAAWVSDLRKRYGTDGTTVIVDATPSVDCDPSLGFFREHLDGLIDDGPLETIPIANFSNDGRLHANAAGSRVISTMVADQILRRMGKTPAAVGAGER